MTVTRSKLNMRAKCGMIGKITLLLAILCGVSLPAAGQGVTNFYGYWDHPAGPDGGAAFVGYVNVGKSLDVGGASDVVAQGIEVIPMVAGFTSNMTQAQWQDRLSEKRDELRSLGAENVRFILLIDEPFGAGFSTAQLEQLIDDARSIIDNPAEDQYFKFGYTFTTTTIHSSTINLPQNADYVGINNYPFRVTGGVADTQASFDADMTSLLADARSKKHADSQIFLVGQAFYGDTKWRQPPAQSPWWYANWVDSESDIEGLLWFEWRSRNAQMTGTTDMPDLAAQQVLVGQELFTAAQEIDITIDFEDDPNMIIVPGYRTKGQSVTWSSDVPSSSAGTISANFTWYTDGAYKNQYAYMVQELDTAYDFSQAQISYWHKQTNRSTWVGVALFSNDELVAEWRVPRSSIWLETQLNAATTTPTQTGTGSIYEVDAIGFMHIDTNVTGSGLGHTVLFDDFVATGVRTIDLNTTEVLSPNGGETLVSGDTASIVWRMPQGVTDVVVEYSTDNGSTWQSVDPANVGNAGFYQWQVPYLNPRHIFGQCLVRITDAAQPLHLDVSDATFSIDSNCQETIVGDINQDCYVNVQDFTILGASWLSCNNGQDPDCQP